MLLLEWDDANRDHIIRHGVTPAEFEQVLERNPYELGYRVVGGEIRFSYIGETARGRILVVVVTERDPKVRPVTSFEPGRYLRNLYLERRKHDG